jgi:hypothetical protein
MKVPWDRGGLRTYLVLLALVFARPGQATIWWGIPLLALGLALHVYAKGCLRQNEVVSTGGPYRFVRHPFYLANLLIDESIALLSGWWPLILLLPVWWLLVYVPVMRGEEQYLSEHFPDIYPAYRSKVPGLIPFRRPLPPVEGAGFSWRNRNITNDTVIPRALRIIAYPLLFLLWGEVKVHRVEIFSEFDAPIVCALALLATIYGLSWVLSRHLKNGRRILPEGPTTVALRVLTIVAVVLVAALLRRPELELNLYLMPIGAFLLAGSIALVLMRGQARVAAEGVALVGVTVLRELPWLSAIPILVYSILMLDRRISARAIATEPQPESPPAA